MGRIICFLLIILNSLFLKAETKAYIYSSDFVFGNKESGLYIEGKLTRTPMQVLLDTVKTNSMMELMKSNTKAVEAALEYEKNYRYYMLSLVSTLLIVVTPKPTNDGDRNLYYTAGSLSLYGSIYFKMRSDYFYYRAINISNGVDVENEKAFNRNAPRPLMNISLLHYSF